MIKIFENEYIRMQYYWLPKEKVNCFVSVVWIIF